MNQQQKTIHERIDKALSMGEQGKYSNCRKELKTLYQDLKENPFVLWEDPYISHLGKAIILMIHMDLLDDEDQNIGLAHLSYLFISKGLLMEDRREPLPDEDERFRILHDRVLLLKSFDDFFTESLIGFYYADKKAENRDQYNQQRKAVLSRIPLMQYADIFLIEQKDPNLRDDEYLLEVSNLIEYDNTIDQKELKEALMLHQILFKYTYQQLQQGKLEY